MEIPKKVVARPKIAIVGIAGRFPDADSCDEFWDLLYRGLDVHRPVPIDRFDISLHSDPSGKRKNTTAAVHGCWIREPGLFDARFFNLSPKEAEQTDPAQRLALVTAYEALEMAGIVPDRTPSTQRDRVGMFYGITSDDYREVNTGQDVGTYFIPGGNRAFVPGRINYHFKFSGPSLAIDTACSSSLAAVHAACNSIWMGDCDTALTGGVNVLTNPDNFCGLDKGHFLSRTGNCKPFDDQADGYCRADSVCSLVLKRLEDAEADKDPILGVILDAGTNHSAEADSITRPHAGAQSRLFNKLLSTSGTLPEDISYVEMHGTGTQAGDAVEMKSVLEVLAPESPPRSSPVHIGSAKANVGHAESASGAVSLIKVLLMMQNNLIPPHVGIKSTINHVFPTNLKERNIFIATENMPWPRIAETPLRKVLVNNFSAAGGNSVILLEDAPVPEVVVDVDPRTVHIVIISAKSRSALHNNAAYLLEFLGKNPGVNLSQLSYTTTARRIHHFQRISLRGSTITEIKAGLGEALRDPDLHVFRAPRSVIPVAFAFTGQGSQYAGMGRQLFESCEQFSSDIRLFDGHAQSHGFPSFLRLITESQIGLEELGSAVLQLGLVCLQMALSNLWRTWGVKPSVVIGHSIGLYAALYAAGVLTAEDTILLVGTRAQLMESSCGKGKSSMIAVKASVIALSIYTDSLDLDISCVNSPNETVLGADLETLSALKSRLLTDGISFSQLNTSYAFHSRHVEPMLERFQDFASNLSYGVADIPIICSMNGGMIDCGKPEIWPEYLRKHCRQTVDFMKGVTTAQQSGGLHESTIWMEVGPHSTCSGMIKSILGPNTTTVYSLERKKDPWDSISRSLVTLYLAGAQISWQAYHQQFKSAQIVLDLPAYSWENKRYWIDYKHNWCLTKGDAPVLEQPQMKKPSWLNSSVHMVVEECHSVETSRLTTGSDLSHPDLKAIVVGHKFNNIPLCPSTIYNEVAVTIARYLQSLRPELEASGIDVCDMNLGKPQTYKYLPEQVFHTSVTMDWLKFHATCSFYSVKSNGDIDLEHATCAIQFSSETLWKKDWERNRYLIDSRIKSLYEGVENGTTDRMKHKMVYKLFTELVEYEEQCRGIEEVWINSEDLEATARVVLKGSDAPQNFNSAPYWFDSLGGLSGFVMNANDSSDLQKQVFINSSWDYFRCVEDWSAGSTYQTYVKMQQVTASLFVGDVYVYHEDKIMMVLGGAKFKRVPRSFMNEVVVASAGSIPNVQNSVKTSIQDTLNHVAKSKVSTSTPATSPLASPVSIEKLMQIISEEIGIPVGGLSDTACFADLGVDSLLSLSISSRIRDELVLECHSEIFHTHKTVQELKIYFQNQDQAQVDICQTPLSGSLSASSCPSTIPQENIYEVTPTGSLSTSTSSSPQLSTSSAVSSRLPSATSVLLHGNPRTSTIVLFLFPDGSGSATSYTEIPSLGPNTAMIGLNSPFLKDTDTFGSTTIEELTGFYLEEVRRRQPRGPYYLAGWSAGGVCAYAAAKILLSEGSEVAALVAIDSPFPDKLSQFPPSLYKFFSENGIFGPNPAKWLIKHLSAVAIALSKYRATPFPPDSIPKSLLIWCEDGIAKEIGCRPSKEDDEPWEATALLDGKSDLGPNGWDLLLGPNLRIETLPNCNHFSMMKGTSAKRLGEILKTAIC